MFSLSILLIIFNRSLLISSELNVYQSDQLIDDDPTNSICLFYRFRDEKLIYQDLSNIWEDFIEYCFRSIDSNIVQIEKNFVNHRDEKYTFEQLKLLNKTIDELLSWSIPLDLLEEYQIYLNFNEEILVNSTLKDKFVYRCEEFWFGDQCQYSFLYREKSSLNEIIENEFEEKSLIIDGSSVSCYIHLECYRGSKRFCLDWREICDGIIDCFNDGIDEINCLSMEINQCEEDEYRCHNGMCIPKEFLFNRNDLLHPFCLDRSDEKNDLSYLNRCSTSPRFRCEEHSCPMFWKPFSCSDGQCVQKFDQCQNGRHRLLIDSFVSSTDICSNILHCLIMFNIIEENRSFCEEIFSNWSIIEQCDDLMIYPSTIPIHLGHLTFLYLKNSILKLEEKTFLLPDYICFNESLCDCYKPKYFYKNFTCLSRDVFSIELNISGNPLIDFIVELNGLFSSCSLPYHLTSMLNNKSSSLYFCSNSQKYLSRSRIADQMFDCCSKDDEDIRISCSMSDRDRIECRQTNQCLASIYRFDDCPQLDFDDKDEQIEIPFERFCNGFSEYFYRDEQHRLLTDESECEEWPCRNLYSECDGFWNCRQGDDEFHCGKQYCPYSYHPCVSLMNNSMICLKSEQVNDGQIDCLGASDEPNFCRELFPTKRNYHRFRCRNSDFCLSIENLCDGIIHCPHGDDEFFCREKKFLCDQTPNSSSMIDEILCQSSEFGRENLIYFSLDKSFQIERKTEKNFHNEKQRKSLLNRFENSFNFNCHRGLRIIQLIDKNQYLNRCLCPPSSFGVQCQFQNQRISLTLEFLDGKINEIYQIVLLLKRFNDEENPIESIDRFDYFPRQSCSIKFNRYILYSNRPKNFSIKYFLHLDIYEKHQLEYLGSYFISIPFEYLPVQRISFRLSIDSKRIFSSNCSLKCFNGQCQKYFNRNEEFCQCYSGWKGKYCHQKINDCHRCSSDSICLGIKSNRSICLCRQGQFGQRCLLKFSCPSSICLNRGQCIHNGFINQDKQIYSCLCSKEFYGSNCQYSKSKFDLTFHLKEIPSFVIVYFLTIHFDSSPSWTMMVEKFTLFQRRLTFYLSNQFHLVLIQIENHFYLIRIDENDSILSSDDQCDRIEKYFSNEQMKIHRYRRLKSFHNLCSKNLHLNCFIDENLICLCTNDRHANCLSYPNETLVRCSSIDKYCFYGKECFSDHHQCSTSKICICHECFFGDQCQFYAKDFGLTLDEILGYEIQSNLSLFQQSFPVQLSFILTLFMFFIGFINGICSIWTFENPQCHENGCGIYLLVSSITSLLTVFIFTLKFLFLFYSTMNSYLQSMIIYSNCFLIEPFLKILVHLDNWLNGCVAIERARTVYQGILFEKKQSRKRSKWIIFILILLNIFIFIPHWSYLQLYFDEKEQRTWCVVRYSSSLQFYQNLIIFIQFFTPFFFNVFSAIFIIIGTARQKDGKQRKILRIKMLKMKFDQHKHLLISPILLIILSLPRLIISITLKCQKSSKYFFLYLAGYFISFLPSVLLFLIFVLPSAIFKKAFQQSIAKKRNYLSGLIRHHPWN